MSRTRVCFLEGLPTITSIVEGFGGVPSLLARELRVGVYSHTHDWFIFYIGYCILLVIFNQWRNSRGPGAQGQSPLHPRGFSPGNFCWPTGKREARKKGEMENKRRTILTGKVEYWKTNGKILKPLNLFWVYQNGNFLLGKAFHPSRKKLGKSDFAPSLKKYSSYATALYLKMF